MDKQSLYKGLASYYDLIYSWKDYKKESKKLTQIILKYKKSKGNDLLEVACGTGHHLQYFRNRFSCVGIDINNGMLAIAKNRMPDIRFSNGNMINFRLDRHFDVITCLFSSIGYVRTYQNLDRTINNLASHLKQGGVVIIEPWLTKSVYKIGYPYMDTYNGKDLKIARLSVSKVKGNLSIIDMNFLVAEKNKEVRYFVDRHELGMFGTNETLQILKKANLDAKFLKNGLMKDRGLFIGIKR